MGVTSNEDYCMLKERVNDIINNFVIKEDEDIFSDINQDKIRAMMILSHAEFESYFESRAENLVNKGKELFDAQCMANKNLSALFIKTTIAEKYFGYNLSDLCDRTIRMYKENILENNHGIKRKNIHAIFEPLGYEEDEFDATLLNDLDSFGGKRGFVAHKSASKTKTVLDYNEQKQTILRILESIKDFDEVLES